MLWIMYLTNQEAPPDVGGDAKTSLSLGCDCCWECANRSGDGILKMFENVLQMFFISSREVQSLVFMLQAWNICTTPLKEVPRLSENVGSRET